MYATLKLNLVVHTSGVGTSNDIVGLTRKMVRLEGPPSKGDEIVVMPENPGKTRPGGLVAEVHRVIWPIQADIARVGGADGTPPPAEKVVQLSAHIPEDQRDGVLSNLNRLGWEVDE